MHEGFAKGMKRIVLAEDSSQLAKLYALHLSNAGYDVTVVADGLAMLEIVLDGGVDLIVSDLMMPGGRGDKAIRILRKQGVTVPALVLSAWTDDADLPDDVQVMEKPVAPPVLVETVRSLLGDG